MYCQGSSGWFIVSATAINHEPPAAAVKEYPTNYERFSVVTFIMVLLALKKFKKQLWVG